MLNPRLKTLMKRKWVFVKILKTWKHRRMVIVGYLTKVQVHLCKYLELNALYSIMGCQKCFKLTHFPNQYFNEYTDLRKMSQSEKNVPPSLVSNVRLVQFVIIKYQYVDGLQIYKYHFQVFAFKRVYHIFFRLAFFH